jgi:hypothetical protein
MAGPAVARAEDDADGGAGVTVWSVAPADESGPDGRHWFELELAPGRSVTERLAVSNRSDRTVVFELSAADGLFNENGRFGMLADPSASAGAGLWISVQPEVEVAPGATEVVSFTVTVPRDAEPGDHAAGIAASVLKRANSDGGGAVGVNSRFGLRVMTRVTGDLVPGLELRGVGASYDLSWQPAEPGRLRVWFELANTGNSRITVTGLVAAQGQEAEFPGTDEPVVELLPGDTRRIEVNVGGVWPLLRVEASIRADPMVSALPGAGDPPVMESVAAKTAVWTPPWPQLLVLLAIVLILAGLLAGRSRSKRRIAALVEETRRQALADAAAPTQAAPLPRSAARPPADGRRPKHALGSTEERSARVTDRSAPDPLDGARREER